MELETNTSLQCSSGRSENTWPKPLGTPLQPHNVLRANLNYLATPIATPGVTIALLSLLQKI